MFTFKFGHLRMKRLKLNNKGLGMENKRKPGEESLWWISLYKRWHATGCYWTILLNALLVSSRNDLMRLWFLFQLLHPAHLDCLCWTLPVFPAVGKAGNPFPDLEQFTSLKSLVEQSQSYLPYCNLNVNGIRNFSHHFLVLSMTSLNTVFC